MSDTIPPDTQPTGEPAICVAARALIGLTEDDDAYRAIVDPLGSDNERIEVADEVSSCMLVAAWLLGWRGRFVPDTIQTTLRQLWGSTGRVPDEDDCVSLGGQVWWSAAGSEPEHVDACVIGVERTALSWLTLTVVAGGQRVTANDVEAGVFPASKLGKRCIKQVRRNLTSTFGEPSNGWIDTGTQRRMLGVHDVGP